MDDDDDREIIAAPRKRIRPYLQADRRGVRVKKPRAVTRGSVRRRLRKNAHRRKRPFSGLRVNTSNRSLTVI